MSVSGQFKLTNANAMEAVMEIRMTVGEWRDIHQELALGHTYTGLGFRRVIQNLLEQADKTFHAREENLKD